MLAGKVTDTVEQGDGGKKNLVKTDCHFKSITCYSKDKEILTSYYVVPSTIWQIFRKLLI